LSEAGYVVDTSEEGDEGLLLVLNIDYNLIILAVTLPGRDGWSILSVLRSREDKRTPVLFLTVRDTVSDRVKGLKLGADDYPIKPFAFSELLAMGILLVGILVSVVIGILVAQCGMKPLGDITGAAERITASQISA
jgi:two-component system, OmpR family, copper resistance phosphate regulon response regulator CusR